MGSDPARVRQTQMTRVTFRHLVLSGQGAFMMPRKACHYALSVFSISLFRTSAMRSG